MSGSLARKVLAFGSSPLTTSVTPRGDVDRLLDNFFPSTLGGGAFDMDPWGMCPFRDLGAMKTSCQPFSICNGDGDFAALPSARDIGKR